MTLDRLAGITQAEFGSVRKDMVTKEDLKRFAAKDDLRLFATRGDLVDLRDTIVDAVREENLKALQSNDKVMTKLDVLLKEDAAHTSLYKTVDDALHKHDQRLKKLEASAK